MVDARDREKRVPRWAGYRGRGHQGYSTWVRLGPTFRGGVRGCVWDLLSGADLKLGFEVEFNLGLGVYLRTWP